MQLPFEAPRRAVGDVDVRSATLQRTCCALTAALRTRATSERVERINESLFLEKSAR